MPNFKTIMFSQNKISFSKIFFSLFFFGLLFSVLPSVVKADSVAVTGYAWSSNIGWIKFDTGKSNPVMYDTVSGKLSGYAWSSNIGWIYFGPNPTNGTSVSGRTPANWAKADSPTSVTSSNVSGWAITCAGTVPGDCSTNVSRSDGWDGWIKMSGSWSSGVSLNLNSSDAKYGEFSGYAWGSEVVGWISFNCSNTNTCGTSDYKVSIFLPSWEEKTLTVNIYGEKWTDGSTIAGGSVTGTDGFNCVGNKTTDSNIIVGKDKLLVTCEKNYKKNVNVDLAASPASDCPAGGCVLKKWDGACSGGNCSLTMKDNKTVSAYFKVSTGIPKGGGSSSSSSVGVGPYDLTVNITGSGSGSVYNVNQTDSTRGGKTWYDYANGTKVKLQVTADSNSTFTGGWVTSSGGNCAGGALSTRDNTNDTCEFTMVEDKTTTVDFGLNSGVTTYNCVSNTCESVSGKGGTHSTLSGCNAVCGGGGGGGGNLLTVNVGSGTVTVEADGVLSFTCSNFATCSQSYSPSTSVTLTATETGGEPFTKWQGGGCSGNDSTCGPLIMNDNRTVYAYFNCSCAGSSCSSCVSISSSSSSVAPPIDGACGTANKKNTKKEPGSSELCKEGTDSGVTETSDGWDWTCSGLNLGSDEICHAGKLEVIIQEI